MRSTGEFAAGWKVLLAAFIGNALSAGTLAFHSLGILGPALGRSFHWGAGIVTGGFLVLSVTTVATAPLVGFFADRFGVRSVALTSTLLLAPAYMAFALLPPSIPAYFCLWFVVAVMGAGTLPVTWLRALNNRFQINKGLALGIALVGTGVSGALLKPFCFWLVDHGGWQAGYLGLGMLSLVSFAVAYLLFFDVEPTLPTGRTRSKLANPASPVVAGTLLSAAIGTKRFWIVLLAVALAALGVGGAVPSMESILKSKALSTADVRTIVPITGLAIIIGRLGSSYLIDHLWAPAVASTMLATASSGFLILAFFQPSSWAAAAIVLIIGLTVGMEVDIAAFLVARYFGARQFSSIYGCVYGAFAVGTGLGTLSYGVALDRFGDFHAALLSSGLILLVSGGLLLTLGGYIFPYVPGTARTP